MQSIARTPGPLDDYELRCCQLSFPVRRSLDLARRIEGALGPIAPLVERMERGHVTTSELALIYRALLRDAGADAPDREALDEWIMDAGVAAAARQVVLFVYSLIIGNEALAATNARISGSMAQAGREAEHTARPFVAMAGSSGPTSSTSPTA
jgi:hypothetical protein